MKFSLVKIIGLLTIFGLAALPTTIGQTTTTRRTENCWSFRPFPYAFESVTKITVSIDANLFLGCDLNCLEFVYLHHANIESIDNNTFNKLNGLKTLVISGNDFKKPTIDTDIFRGLTSLKVLYLNDNNLESINQRVFKSLESLELLYLSNNRLKIIEQNTFDGLGSNLVYLYLSGNQITEINQNVFQELKKLKILDLSYNPLTKNRIDRTGFPAVTKW